MSCLRTQQQTDPLLRSRLVAAGLACKARPASQTTRGGSLFCSVRPTSFRSALGPSSSPPSSSLPPCPAFHIPPPTLVSTPCFLRLTRGLRRVFFPLLRRPASRPGDVLCAIALAVVVPRARSFFSRRPPFPYRWQSRLSCVSAFCRLNLSPVQIPGAAHPAFQEDKIYMI